MGFRLIVAEIFAEDLPDTDDVRSATSEICRRLESTHAGLVRELSRVDDNSAIHTVRFYRFRLDALPNVLHHLRNQLGCRGSIGLTIT